MKKHKILIVSLTMLLAVGGMIFVACKSKAPSGDENKAGAAGEISHYTCPMHPHIHEDEPGECPICHMKLVPVYQEGAAPSEIPTEGPTVSISPERQQLIGIKTQVAEKKLATKEIRTVGRVAFDPELAVAQREFLEIVKGIPSLKEAARSRLRLLGMSAEEIRELEQKKGASLSLYLPASSDSVWIYATLYQGELELVPAGLSAEISFPSGSTLTLTGTVRAVDPIIDPMTRSARARIEVPEAGGVLRPDSFVTVVLKVPLGEVTTIPKSAVIDTGVRQVAFVVHEGRHFQARDITIGSELGDEMVVLGGIEEGETVVSSATFLVDSESQLKAAVAGLERAPACPEGQAWDVGMNMCMPKAGS